MSKIAGSIGNMNSKVIGINSIRLFKDVSKNGKCIDNVIYMLPTLNKYGKMNNVLVYNSNKNNISRYDLSNGSVKKEIEYCENSNSNRQYFDYYCIDKENRHLYNKASLADFPGGLHIKIPFYNLICAFKDKEKGIIEKDITAMSNEVANGKYMVVNHMDNNSCNNSMDNLEIVPVEYNNLHSRLVNMIACTRYSKALCRIVDVSTNDEEYKTKVELNIKLSAYDIVEYCNNIKEVGFNFGRLVEYDNRSFKSLSESEKKCIKNSLVKSGDSQICYFIMWLMWTGKIEYINDKMFSIYSVKCPSYKSNKKYNYLNKLCSNEVSISSLLKAN